MAVVNFNSEKALEAVVYIACKDFCKDKTFELEEISHKESRRGRKLKTKNNGLMLDDDN
ncbi:MAG: hypothetical protein LBM19_02595 [Holosporales bacterium]|jgi:hypothetical protein|nr:hypothetical protein [Holosporales bacterium]